MTSRQEDTRARELASGKDVTVWRCGRSETFAPIEYAWRWTWVCRCGSREYENTRYGLARFPSCSRLRPFPSTRSACDSPRLPRACEMRTRMNGDKAERTYVTYLSGVSGSIQIRRRQTEICRTAATSRSYVDSCFAPGRSPPPWHSIWKRESTWFSHVHSERKDARPDLPRRDKRALITISTGVNYTLVYFTSV